MSRTRKGLRALWVTVFSMLPAAAQNARPELQVVADPELREQAGVLVAVLAKLGVQGASLTSGSEPRALRRVRFQRSRKAAWKGTERYSIESDGTNVSVLAGSQRAAAHAAAELVREAELEGDEVHWGVFERSAEPELSYRSFMLDMGRNPHGPEILRKVVDMLWFYRANVLHLHLTDDQLISWPSKAFPKLYDGRAGWTLEDYVALESYARARGVWIVPEVDVPGHSTILRREYPEVFGTTQTDLARSPEAQKGVEVLLDEMLAVFGSTPYVHIGGDEAYGVPEELQRDFINRLDRFVKSRGKRTVVWEGPRLGTGSNKVDEGVLHINWRTINFPAQEMLDTGYEVVNAAWDPMYIVDHYPRTMFTAVGVKECFEWNPRRFKHISLDMPTFATPHVTKSAEGILGFCMPYWEGREENLMPLCLPRFAAVATAAWDLAGRADYESYRKSHEATLPRLLLLSGIELPSLPLADPASQKQNLAFGRPVEPSAGASQPHFGPQRLTNGLLDRFDHFLGYPTSPTPLNIVIPLDQRHEVERIVVHEAAVGASFEQYRVEVSLDGKRYVTVGSTQAGSRAERSFVEHRFAARRVSFVRIVTDGCQNLTFPSFSRLVEVQVFGPAR